MLLDYFPFRLFVRLSAPACLFQHISTALQPDIFRAAAPIASEMRHAHRSALRNGKGLSCKTSKLWTASLGVGSLPVHRLHRTRVEE